MPLEDRLLEFNTGSIQELVYDEKENALWMVQGNSSGFRKLDLRNYELKQFKVHEYIEEDIPDINYPFESILIDLQDDIWLGTWGTGLFVFDKRKSISTIIIFIPKHRIQ
ncbi:hypothetical protein [Mariniphaga sediminis]|uniref:hypothetical protein n=1 Tax=Mariniphaga sediminis TaxID=1628158 RepID=UPI0035636D05